MTDFHMRCQDNVLDGLKAVLEGEYDIPGEHFARPPVVVDVGANVGSFALWASHRWPGCELHCYEPHPDNFRLLVENLERNRVYATASEVAVANGDGTGTLYEGVSNCGEHSLFTTYGHEGKQTTKTVRVIHAERLPKADVLKLDTEGAELLIMREVLPRHKPKLIMYEWHRPEDQAALRELLEPAYRCHSDEATETHRGVAKWVLQ